jgi:biotin carboxyl carrier protein
MKYITTVNNEEFIIEILDDRRVVINGKEYQIDFHPVSEQPVYSMLVDGKSYEAYVNPADNTWSVLLHGHQYSIQIEDEREKRLRSASSRNLSEGSEYHLKAPMPGLVITVLVKEGQKIKKDELLLILESMKMQNELKSPRDGVVSRIRIQPGESVEQRQILLTIT